MDYQKIGLIGFTNQFILMSIVIWRWSLFFFEKSSGKINFKKHFAFFLLLLAPAVDLPMYCSFFVLNRYVLMTFSFHKFQPAALFAAYSLVISDWSNVLFEIKEDNMLRFLCRNGSLVVVNMILLSISIANFVYCYSFPDIHTYATSDVYEVSVLVQIVAPFILTSIMLNAGLKLSWRIQGASGALAFSNENEKKKEFQSAVFHLNVVMMSVCLTILAQVNTPCKCVFAINLFLLLVIHCFPVFFLFLFGLFIAPLFSILFLFSPHDLVVNFIRWCNCC